MQEYHLYQLAKINFAFYCIRQRNDTYILSRDLIYVEEQPVTQCRLVVRLSTAGKGPWAGEIIVFIVSTDPQGDTRA